MEITKYEHARLIGARAYQLAQGAPPLIEAEQDMDFIKIAEKELQSGAIPLRVLRDN